MSKYASKNVVLPCRIRTKSVSLHQSVWKQIHRHMDQNSIAPSATYQGHAGSEYTSTTTCAFADPPPCRRKTFLASLVEMRPQTPPSQSSAPDILHLGPGILRFANKFVSGGHHTRESSPVKRNTFWRGGFHFRHFATEGKDV